MSAPLKGIVVADFTTLLPGPLATLMLAEAGAEVIKVERPGGEEGRGFLPRINGVSAPFAVLNRGKQGIQADLKTEEGEAKAMALVERADILVEQFRPGVMERLGFGYEALKRRNPKLIYCSITGYGQSGPRRDEAGHDLNYIGATGLLSLSPGPGDRPTVPPALIADIGGGTFPAVINILLALIARTKTGEGSYLDIAMTDAMFTFAWHALAQGFASGRYPGSGDSTLTGGSPRYQLYPTQDGRLVACAALEDHFWERFAEAIGLGVDYANDTRNPQATRAEVARLIAARPASDWEPVFAKADCCATIVASLEEALGDPHFVERGLFSRQVLSRAGGHMPALPVPIAPQFRDAPDIAKPAPPLR